MSPAGSPPATAAPLKRPQGLDSPIVPKIMKLMSRINVAVYRATGGRIGRAW